MDDVTLTGPQKRKYNSFRGRVLKGIRDQIKSHKYEADKVLSENKGRSVDVRKKRLRKLKALLKASAEFTSFLDQHIGSEADIKKAKSRRSKIISLVAGYFNKEVLLREVSEEFDKIALATFKDLEIHKNQKHLKEILPEELRAFLPPTIVVDVGEDGEIKRIRDLFANKIYGLEQKIKNQKKLIRKYNSAVVSVKKDLKSKNEKTKLSALILCVIMETGIRPGRVGNGVVKVEGGVEERVETFGAVTLSSKHVRFVKDNFVELKFKGKKGTVNIASLTDEAVINVLKDYMDKSKEGGGSPYLFYMEDGTQYDYAHLKSYFNKKFKDFKITDFRKLRATQTVFDTLQEERKEMLKEIKGFADLEEEEVKKKVTNVIVKTLNKAHERAQIALSHEDSSTTNNSYINPEVILRFLSTSKVNTSLRQCLLDGKTKLKFDPMVFVKESRTASTIFVASGGHTHLTWSEMRGWLLDVFGSR
jgi:DNA topoisomerase IB